MTDNTVICRCEDVTYGQIVAAIERGCRTVEEVKRMLRCGMGACQGRTCVRLISQIMAAQTGVALGQIAQPTFRPPTMPMELFILAGETDEKEC